MGSRRGVGDLPPSPGRGAVDDPAAVAVTLVLATSTGGIGRHVRSLAAGLVERGLTVAVCAPAETEDLFGFRAAGAAFRPIEIAAGFRPGRDARALRRLRPALDRADVVHAHGLRAGALAGLALTGRPTPFVVTWHNPVSSSGPTGAAYRVVQGWLACRADITLAASADLADSARLLGGRDVRPAEVSAPRLPAPSRPPAEVRRELGALGRPLVLAVSRLHPQKGLETLVAAAAGWRDRDPVPLVVIAGDGPIGPDLRAQIDRTGVAVRLLGRREDIADLLAAADVVVVPSRWEARSLVAQEAVRAGRPLVATAVGGLPALLGDQAALLVPPADPRALAAAVSRLLDEPGMAAALAARGLTRSKSWPDEAATVRRVAAVCTELTGRRV